MPNRELREGLVTSEKLANVSDFAFRLYVNLVLRADDYGRFHADARLVRSACLPLLHKRIVEVEQAMEELAALGPDGEPGLIVKYWGNSRPYLLITQWKQRVRCNGSKFPEPPQDVVCPRPMPGMCRADDWHPPPRIEERGTRGGERGAPPPSAAAPQEPPPGSLRAAERGRSKEPPWARKKALKELLEPLLRKTYPSKEVSDEIQRIKAEIEACNRELSGLPKPGVVP